MALPIVCPECGIHNPAEYRWCECGFDLDRLPPIKKPLLKPSLTPSDDAKVVQEDARQGGIEMKFANILVQKFRRLFAAEWTWRLFVSLQVLGILSVIYLDITSSGWSVWPSYLYNRFSWDLLESRYWTGGYDGHRNWLVVIGLVGPFVVTKAIDWIASARTE